MHGWLCGGEDVVETAVLLFNESTEEGIMGIEEKLKLIRANVSRIFTVPILFAEQQEALKEKLESVEDEQRDLIKEAFIAENARLRVEMTRLSEEEVRLSSSEASEAVLRGRGSEQDQYAEFSRADLVVFNREHRKSLWTKTARHVTGLEELNDNGTWVTVGDALRDEWLQLVNEHMPDAAIWLLQRYLVEVERDKKAAEASPDFLEMGS